MQLTNGQTRAAVAALLTILAGPWIDAAAAHAGWPAADMVGALSAAIVYAIGWAADRLVTKGAKP